MSETTTQSDVEDSVIDVDSCNQAELEDLKQAVTVLKHLRKENLKLTKNFDNLKAIHLELLASHRHLESEHSSLKQERVKVEQQYQQLCESWRRELEEKQHQFELARAQILEPRDLDLLKVQLLQEVEAPFKAKCEALAKEAEAAQKQFVRLRREHESLQNTIRSQQLLQKGELDVLRGQHDALQHALDEKTSALDSAQGKVQRLEQQLRQQQQQKEDASMQLLFLRDEVLELRQAKDAAVVEKEQLVIRSERRNQQLQAEVKELQSLAESLTRKNRHLNDELSESSRAQEAAHTQLMSLQASNTTLTAQLADAQAVLTRERQLHTDRTAAAEQLWQERINDLLGQVLQKERQLAQLALSEQQALQQAEADAAEQLAAAQEAAVLKQREAAAQLDEVRMQLEAAHREIADLQGQLSSMKDKAQAQLAAAAAQLQHQPEGGQEQLQSQQQQALKPAGSSQVARGTEHGTAAAAGPDSTARIQAEARCAYLEQRVQQLEQQLTDANSKLSELHQQHEQLQRESDKRVAAVKQAATADRDALGVKHAARIKKLQEAAKDQIRTLRSKLKDTRATVDQLSSEVSGLKITLHERDAELAAFVRSSMERPRSAGSPIGLLHESYSRSPIPGASLQSPRRPSLAAVTSGVRQRQQQYLEEAAAR